MARPPAARPIQLMETAVRQLEDWWFLHEKYNIISYRGGNGYLFSHSRAVTNFKDFRQHLLRLHLPADKQTHRLWDFLPPANFPNPTQSLTLIDVPESAESWCKQSRRLFRLDLELQRLLELTKLGKTTWADVQLPFKAFAIELAEPMVDPEQGHSYTLIVVSTIPGPSAHQKRYRVYFMGTDNKVFQPLTTEQRQTIEDLVRRNRLKSAYDLCRNLLKAPERFWGFACVSLTLTFPDMEDIRVESSGQDMLNRNPDMQLPMAPEAFARRLEFGDTKLRIVAGLLLYLKTLPVGSEHVKNRPPPPDTPKPAGGRLVTDGADIFTVHSDIALNDEEKLLLGVTGTPEEQAEARRKAGYGLKTHHRMGFWARPKGLGHDPTAKRSQWRRPTIVNRHKLGKEPGLPEGAITRRKSAERSQPEE